MQRLRFFDEVHDFQRFVRENIKLIGNYTIITEQLTLKNNETGILDMLVVDNNDNRLTLLELKNTYTTDKNIWQPLRYYDLIRRGEDGLKELLIKAGYKSNDIDLTPKLVLVVPESNDQLLRSLSYFDHIDSCVVEIARFDNGAYIETRKETFYPTSIFHKEDLVNVKDKISKDWNFNEYRKHGINSNKIDLALRLTNQIKALFQIKGYHFDVFFTETKVTITKNKKVWAHLFIKQEQYSNDLVCSFKVGKDAVINKLDFIYNPSIGSFERKPETIKIKANSVISTELLNLILG